MLPEERDAVVKRSLLAAVPTPCMLLRQDGQLVAVSDAWRELLAESGVPPAEQSSWLPEENLLAALRSAAQAPGGLYEALAGHVRAALSDVGAHTSAEIQVPFPTGARWFIVATSSPAAGELLVLMTDITSRRAAEMQLAHQATHDTLTGLPNRSVLVERLRQVGGSRRGGEAHDTAVFFLDLDEFKAVNDTLGHAAGDAVLREVAHRLQSVVRSGDLVARLGGDEFVVVASRLSGQLEALAYADRLLAALAPVVVVNGQPLAAQASIGVAMTSPEDETSESLLRDADIAMLKAKADRSGHRVFNSVLHSARRQRADAVQALRLAIESGETAPWFQPVVDLRDGRTVGAEALVRWVRADGTVVPPAQFLPLAERTGLIGPLDRRVMQAAAAEVATGALSQLADVAVNASPLQITSGLILDEVRAVLDTSGLAAERLTVELTETAVLGDPRAARQHLEELKRIGVRLALDDFGTGYSSLSHLADLPMDIVKLDRSFVRQITSSRRSREISRGVIGMGNALGMAVIAEGVEGEEQRDALLDMDCPYAQGFLYGAAVPADRFASLHLRAERPGLV